jgi:hypothetical protein
MQRKAWVSILMGYELELKRTVLVQFTALNRVVKVGQGKDESSRRR